VSNAKVLIEIAGPSNVPVGFVDGVEEVRRDNYEMNALPMLDISRTSGLGSGVACADCNAVPY
jgi:hypothetical protein